MTQRRALVDIDGKIQETPTGDTLYGAGDISGAAALAPSSSSRNVIQPTSAAVIPMTIKGASAQTADLEQWQDSTGTVLAKIDALGSATFASPCTIGSAVIGIAPNGDGWSTRFGGSALASNVLGNSNTAIGFKALNAAGGSNNVAIGAWAGAYYTGGNALFIGGFDTGNATNDLHRTLIRGQFNSGTSGQNLWFNCGTVTINSTGSAPINPPAGTTLHLLHSGVTLGRIMQTVWGTGAYAAYAGRSARGTYTSPTALQSGDEITHLSAWGYGATGFSSAYRAGISLWAAENWTDSAQGTRISFYTTAPTTVTTSEKVRVWGDGGVQIGGTFTASPGAGALLVNADTTIGSASYFYLGDSVTNGSWRIGRSGNNLVFERRESGSWVTKNTITA